MAEAIATELGIAEVHAEVLPPDKAEVVRAAQGHGARVAFVGDGINDAPALARADVGIAMGGGTDIAIEAGDVVLMRGDPQAVVDAIGLARRTRRTIRVNFLWAYGYNLLLIPVAAGALHPFWGVDEPHAGGRRHEPVQCAGGGQFLASAAFRIAVLTLADAFVGSSPSARMW